jgi:hypothetical protein
MYLLILGAGTIGCGTSEERKAEAGSLASEPSALVEGAAPEQKAADTEANEENARARRKANREEANRKRAFLLGEGNSPIQAENYVKVKVEVKLRGQLTCTEEAVTVSTDSKHKWGSSRFRVGDFHSFGSMQVRIFSRR